MKQQLTLRQFPPRKKHHNNNQQQTLDFLQLMNDGMEFINRRVAQRKPHFHSDRRQTLTDIVPYVMFLDDDVELCPGFSSIVDKAMSAFPFFGMAHLGRGGSGILIPSYYLEAVHNQVKDDSSRLSKPKNIDKSMLEWALQQARVCTLRSVTIQMRHIGFGSSLAHQRQMWEDTDFCGAPANNKAWQGLSESASQDFFGEYCTIQHTCNSYASQGANHNCSHCQDGYIGKDCGIPNDGKTYRRRKNNAPLVALLPGNLKEDALTSLLSNNTNENKHNLVNLYVIGDCPEEEAKWLSTNIYVSPKTAREAFHDDLKDTPRWGNLAFPVETIYLDSLLPPQELWSLRYYERI